MPVGLQQLVESLQLELFKAGFILERRRFAAHVTLLRKAEPQPLPPLPPAEWPAREFALVASTNGAYRTLERFALG
jgi:2'-5' RNA ligase